MPDEEITLEAARERLIELIEADDWEVTKAATTDGFAILRATEAFPTQGRLVRYALDLLKSRFPMHAVALGDPPGASGVGYVMNNADGHGLYIKLRIEEDRTAWIVSFHTSKHYRE